MVIFIAILIVLIALAVPFMPVPEKFKPMRRPGAGLLIFGAVATALSGAVSYNDAGYCVHIRTIFGGEDSKCDLGWYFSGWGDSTQYPHYITITHTLETDASGSSVSSPYSIRMADNWAGTVTQTTRFGIPQDDEQFLKMARDFRSPERLITSTLRPAVTSSLDSIANLFTMEEYYAGGRRDDFKTEFRDAVTKGRAKIERIEVKRSGVNVSPETAPSDSPFAQDTARTGSGDSIRVVTKKKLGPDGNPIRIANGFTRYGVVVSTAIIQNLDPDDAFEDQIKERKDAAARRSVAKEQRLEQEEQRKLSLAKAERNIAERQGAARVDQIQKTTDAETAKRLALIAADQRREEARIAKETAQLNLERASIDAQAQKVLADAQAYEKEAILTADGALEKKLAAYVETQKSWADAFARRAVPATVMGSQAGGTGNDRDVDAFLSLLTAKAAKDLQLDLSISPAKQ